MIGSFFGGAIGKAAKGAFGGAIIGGMSGGGLDSVAGGAIGGALTGAVGGHYVRSNRPANMASRGLHMARRGTTRLQSAAFDRFSRKGGDRFLDVALGAKRATGMIDTARGFIGTNRAAINKWGGRAALSAGIASGAYIGASAVNSNRGY